MKTETASVRRTREQWRHLITQWRRSGESGGEFALKLGVLETTLRTHAKILWHDGRGYYLLYRRLDRGTCRIPLALAPGAKDLLVTPRELALLFEGIDHALLRRARQVAAKALDRSALYDPA